MAGPAAEKVSLASVLQRYGVKLHPTRQTFHVLCPIHTEDTPSCHVDLKKQTWHCFGCGAGGDAVDLVKQKENVDFAGALEILGIQGQQEKSRKQAAQAPSPFTFHQGQPPAPTTTAAAEDEETQQAISAAQQLYNEHCTALLDTPAAWYCESRGIPAVFAAASGARYCADYLRGGPAIVFPVCDQAGEMTAVQGRYLSPAPAGSDRPDKKTRGRLRGVFSTTNAMAQRDVIVTEAPLDALSLAVCGFPALALLGTHYPDWLPGAIGARRVYLATDNDKAGDGAAQKLCDHLATNGGKIFRLKPEGVKDWNDHLCTYGPVVMESAIIAAAFPGRLPCVPRSLVDLAPTLPAGAPVLLQDGTAATVLQYHNPDEDLPAGWVEIETHDGRRGQIDCRDLRDGSGAPLVPYPLLTWREKLAKGRKSTPSPNGDTRNGT